MQEIMKRFKVSKKYSVTWKNGHQGIYEMRAFVQSTRPVLKMKHPVGFYCFVDLLEVKLIKEA